MRSITVPMTRFDVPVRTIGFALSGIAFLALALPAFFEPMTFWTGLLTGDYVYQTHEVHQLILGAVMPVLLLGVIAQVYRPSERVGALHTAIVIWVAALVSFTVGGEASPILFVLLALLLAMAAAHPSGRAQLPDRASLDRPLAIVAVVTALLAVVLGGNELYLHLTETSSHVLFGHYVFMATMYFSVGALTVYGSFRGVNWRYPIYAAAFFLIVVGTASVMYPGDVQGSSLGALGVLAIAWALVIVAVAERERLPIER